MQLHINDTDYEVDAEGETPLLWVLRDDLGMTGTKYGCGIAQCGACSVLVDGVVTRSCVTPVESVAGASITTIEAIEQDAVGKRVVDAWVRHQVPQCGYCQSGQVIAATSLLKAAARPSAEQVRATMVNLCRCGTYNYIKAAMDDLAGLHAQGPQQAAAQTPTDGVPLPGGLAIGTAAGAALVAGGAAVMSGIGRESGTGVSAGDAAADEGDQA